MADLCLGDLESDEVRAVLTVDHLQKPTEEADISMLASRLGFTATDEQREIIRWFRTSCIQNGSHEMWALLKLKS